MEANYAMGGGMTPEHSVGTQPGVAVSAPSTPTAGSTGPAATAMRKRGSNSKRAAAQQDANGYHSVNVVLDKEMYNFFTEQSAKIEYGPTLSKYLQVQLRKLMKQTRQQEQVDQPAQQPAQQSAAE
jgi:hypothetical protein